MIGPYDCREFEIRKPIKDIENIAFKKLSKQKAKEINVVSKTDNKLSIKKVNKSIESSVKKALSEKSLFIKNKSPIKLWLEDVVINKSKPEIKSKKPNGWRTFNQDLDDEKGWG